MKAYCCDRCGAIFGSDRPVYVEYGYPGNPLVNEKGTLEKIEVCPACADDFKSWLQFPPEKSDLAPDFIEKKLNV